MSNGFARPITIKEAINNIVDRTYLLPAIQRKFVWNSDQIEVLFDSIMRGYPINSFMFWEVKESKIKNDFKFYQFLTEFRQLFKEDNLDIDTTGYKDFKAVIDGQQRLTSIYLGLKGSYAYKLPRKWWKNDEENLPTRYLYLNLANPLSEDNERQMVYDFQFLTKKEIDKKTEDQNSIWFKANDILKFEKPNDLDKFIESKGWSSNDFVKDTIRQFRRVVFDEQLINYYLETTQEIDTVLDIFIRTNSGGQSLSFSDLLMSITTANWKSNARKEIGDVVDKVRETGNPGFIISKDLVLKACLVLFNDNIKFQVKNFEPSNVTVFELNWDRIKNSIIGAFELLANLGFNNDSLRAKNAAIPIIYYIYHRGIENDINNLNKYKGDKELIRKWLNLSLLNGVFGSQSDTVLASIKRAIKAELADTSKQPTFPLDRIKEEFKETSKSLSFENDFIEGLLSKRKDSPEAFPILSLIYSHLKFDNQDYDKDHLHPADYFRKKKRTDFKTEEDFNFYTDPANWDSILNLQLLNKNLNRSKQDKPLKEWIESNKISKRDQLIPEEVSLDVADFKTFLTERKNLLIEQLKKMTV